MIGLTNIEKRFGDNLVLKGVTVSIDEGSVTALVGPSGGGKSTLLRCINLLEIPTSGSLRIGEETLAFHPGGKVPAKDIQRIRLQTGMVFQNFQLFPHRTAIENVMEGLVTVLKWSEPRARERAMALLEKVGMAHKADAWPATLSGGQQQRVAIARAIVTKPTLLVADEPTGNLDTARTHEIMELLTRLNAELGLSIVMVTHEADVADYAGRTIRFLDGHVASDTLKAEAAA
ncbi:MAG: amino acid ABC transporter ATP-binding protein [Mesorhizobium sp.]|nr:MAG: amino acid ABC transporter ATP-binding protein [Mesorhizobium sp.]